MNAIAWPVHLDASLVDPALPTPLYHQIYLLLRDTIRRGEFAAGAVLPGEHDLAERFAVSRITVKRALNELATDALVTRHRGRGTIVTPALPLSVVRGSVDTLLDSLKQMGAETRVKLLEFAEVPAGDAVAEQFEIDASDRIQRAVRLRTIDDAPFVYIVSYVPLPLARTYTRSELASQPLLTLLERAGVRIDESDTNITAVAAEPRIAQALGIGAGSPLLRIDRMMRDKSGEPVELIHGYYRPDRFAYNIQQSGLSKRNGNGASRSTPKTDDQLKARRALKRAARSSSSAEIAEAA